MKFLLHGGVNYIINQQIVISPKFWYQGQTKAAEISLGGDLGYKLQTANFDGTLYGGLWYRLSDAVIPYVGLGYKDFRLGMSYDVNVSSLNAASNGKGGFEVSLIYIGRLSSTPTTIVVPCIRF